MDLGTLIRRMEEDGELSTLARNPTAQFGTPARRYLGAEILPERLVPENGFREEGIKFRSVIANAAERYSPTQKKGGALAGGYNVILAESDIASEFTSRDHDALIAMLRRNNTVDAMATLIRFLDTTVVRPLIEWNERARWQVLLNNVALLRGDNEYTEDVPYLAVSGHRVTPGTAWSNDAYDPFLDIHAMVELLASKGYNVARIITTRTVVGILAGNDKVKTRANRIAVAPGGSFVGMPGRITLAEINQMLSADGLPPFELYDLSYQTMTGTGRFFDANSMFFAGETGSEEAVPVSPDVIEVLPNTLGYVGVGRPAGQSDPGRVVRQEAFRSKPPRVEAEGWQTSLPVITEPEAKGVIYGIS